MLLRTPMEACVSEREGRGREGVARGGRGAEGGARRDGAGFDRPSRILEALEKKFFKVLFSSK